MTKYDPTSMCADEFINHQEILDTLAYAEANKNNRELIDEILRKAQRTSLGDHCAALTHREAAVLLASV